MQRCMKSALLERKPVTASHPQVLSYKKRCKTEGNERDKEVRLKTRR